MNAKMRPGEPVDPDVPNANVMRWQSGDYVADFAHRTMRPVEVVLLLRYREALSERVLEPGCRRELLADLRVRLTPPGVLIFSSHNLAFVDADRPALTYRRVHSKLNRPIVELVKLAPRLPARVRNRRRVRPLERRGADHAMLNDEALDYPLLHYYIRSDDEARQLEQLGYELIECLDLEGRAVTGDASDCPELHYVARRR